MRPQLLVVRRVRAIDPGTALDATVDVVVEEGRLTRIGPEAATPELVASPRAEVLDGSGYWLLPAFVELHAHLREPGQEHKETIAQGLRAAAAGGYAHVCAMPNTRPVNDCVAVTEQMLAAARTAGSVALHPIAAITRGLAGEELTDMAALQRAGAVAVSDDGRCVSSAAVMRRALEQAARLDLPLIQHAEEHSLTAGAQLHEGAVSAELGWKGWPRQAEDAIVARDLILLGGTGGRYHLAHASTRGAVALVREAKARGLHVTAEATPHHLLATVEELRERNPLHKVNPPLREADDVTALRAALADGTIDAIATDHAPHAAHEKGAGFEAAPPGMIGLELSVALLLGLVHAGEIPLRRFVEALTLAPARIIGLPSPTLREASPASFCLLDPFLRHTLTAARLHSKSHNTPFLGREVVGAVVGTFVGGQWAHGPEPLNRAGSDSSKAGA